MVSFVMAVNQDASGHAFKYHPTRHCNPRRKGTGAPSQRRSKQRRSCLGCSCVRKQRQMTGSGKCRSQSATRSAMCVQQTESCSAVLEAIHCLRDRVDRPTSFSVTANALFGDRQLNYTEGPALARRCQFDRAILSPRLLCYTQPVTHNLTESTANHGPFLPLISAQAREETTLAINISSPRSSVLPLFSPTLLSSHAHTSKIRRQ